MLSELIGLLLAVGLGFAEIIDNTNPNICDTGECVPHYLCINNKIVTDGTGIIDERANFVDEECILYNNNTNNKIVTGNNVKGASLYCDYSKMEICCGVPQEPIVIEPISGCGQIALSNLKNRVLGGEHAGYAEFPWMVAILELQTTDNQQRYIYLSGGSLIHPGVVLTAAHRMEQKSAYLLKARLGDWDIQTTANEKYPHEERSVIDILSHDQFDADTLENNVALLFLNQSVKLGEHIQTVCLPPPNTKFDNKICLASSWGESRFESNEILPEILKKLELPIVPSDKCETQLRTILSEEFSLHKTFLCAGGEVKVDTCRSDGGSPLVCHIDNTNERYYQIGIVAWGIGCGNEIPGIYVNVAEIKNWIDAIFTNRNLDKSFYTYE